VSYWRQLALGEAAARELGSGYRYSTCLDLGWGWVRLDWTALLCGLSRRFFSSSAARSAYSLALEVVDLGSTVAVAAATAGEESSAA